MIDTKAKVSTIELYIMEVEKNHKFQLNKQKIEKWIQILKQTELFLLNS